MFNTAHINIGTNPVAMRQMFKFKSGAPTVLA